jgi:hypothetical protein
MVTAADYKGLLYTRGPMRPLLAVLLTVTIAVIALVFGVCVLWSAVVATP